MDALAFFTYLINFLDFNLISFMSYTYNIGTGLAPMTAPSAWPCDNPHDNTTAPQPHSLHLT